VAKRKSAMHKLIKEHPTPWSIAERWQDGLRAQDAKGVWLGGWGSLTLGRDDERTIDAFLVAAVNAAHSPKKRKVKP